MTRRRRDPRAELAALQVAAGSRSRLDRASHAVANRRPRRDPRAEQTRQLVASDGRPRFDRSQRISSAPLERRAAPVAPVEALRRVVTVDGPAFIVAVVPDAPGGRLTPHDRQLLGAARLLARETAAVLVLSPTSLEEIGGAGADRVLTLARETFDPGRVAAMLAAQLEQLAVRHVLFPETPRGGDLARRVALAMREPLFTRCESVSPNSVTRASGGHRVEQRTAPPRLIALLPDAVAPYGGDPREARQLDAVVPPGDATGSAIVSVEEIPADPASVPLAQADFVVSAGNGLADLAMFRKLVSALNASPGASRMLCDAGLMPRDAQVGASGTVLSATCYVALGIAGAPQHLQGVADCQHVVAVNTDLHAAMIARAGLAIVQDAQRVMPALLEALAREERAR